MTFHGIVRTNYLGSRVLPAIQSPVLAQLSDQAIERVLTPRALEFIGELHARYEPRRRELLRARGERRAEIAAGRDLAFLDPRSDARAGDWRVAPPRPDYADRRVEITGPTDRKLVINALNSGARGFMADFEDASSPTWRNQVEGQLHLLEAVEGTLQHEQPDGRVYRLGATPATLLVRPRGWHLDERHLQVRGEPVSGALVDFGLSLLHLGSRQLARGTAPYYYLPKLEHHLEARLWNDIFVWAQDALGMPRGTIRATVLIETLPAAFQMEEILFELREHSYGLNAGRWDYIFSVIKCYRHSPAFVLPDRVDVTMAVPFMRAYADLLVATCHRRGAFAMGGMAALIPSSSDPEATARAIAGVQQDKRREAGAGFDGTWVAHPAVVDAARAEFDAVLGSAPNQIERQLPRAAVDAANLLAVAQTPGAITARGIRDNVALALRYLVAWLDGRGAVAINHLMEDAATAEIARAQLWQWLRHDAVLADGRHVTRALVESILEDEADRLAVEAGGDQRAERLLAHARSLVRQLVLDDELPEFLTLLAYDLLEEGGA